jgi:4-amino-4-deoxy-L-arabinose transferase-like glycosyltransferase
MRKRKNEVEKKAGLMLIAIVIVGLTISTFFFYGPSMIDGIDNYIYTDSAHSLLSGHFNAIGVLPERYILIGGIAFFFLLFGYNQASAAMFGEFCFILTIVAIYLIGKDLYSNNAGLIAAFLYSIFPMAVIYAPNVSDSIPMAFFATVSVLLAIRATKIRERHFKIYSVLAGFFMVSSYLVTPETVVIIPVVFFVFIMNYRSARKIIKLSIIFLSIGILLAGLLIAILGLETNGNLLSLITTVTNFYAQSYSGLQSSFYMNIKTLFPYSILSTMHNGNFLAAFEELFSNIFSDYGFYYTFGLFGYVTAFFAVILLLQPRHRAAIPLFWFIFVLLYLSFGTASLTKYVFMPQLPRYLLLLAPAAMLIISFGFLTLLEKLRKHNIAKMLVELLFVILVLILLANSVVLIKGMAYSQFKYVYPLINVGNFLISQYEADPNITVYGDGSFPLGVYTEYKIPIMGVPAECFQINHNSLIVVANNSKIISECNLILIYKPPAAPSWLDKYNVLDSTGNGFGGYVMGVYKPSS